MSTDINPGHVFKEGVAVTYDTLNKVLGGATINPIQQGRVDRLYGALGTKAEAKQANDALAKKADKAHKHPLEDLARIKQELEAQHGHAMADIDGLQELCDGLSSTLHRHAATDIDGLAASLEEHAQSGQRLQTQAVDLREKIDAQGKWFNERAAAKAEKAHGHGVADITTLQEGMDRKAALWHTHNIQDVSGLHADLQRKTDAAHGHGVGMVNGLQASLDGKAASGHRHHLSTVNGLGSAAGRRVVDKYHGAKDSDIPTADLAIRLIAHELHCAYYGTSSGAPSID